MKDIRCPHCTLLLFRGASTMHGLVEVKCTRSGRRSRCGWKGVLQVTPDDITPHTTLIPSHLDDK